MANSRTPSARSSGPGSSSGGNQIEAVRTGGDGARALAQHVAAEITSRLSASLAPGLYLVATPIGNLADITLRALVVLATADHLLCEDTRQSQKILQRFGIRQRLDTYHEHNADRVRPRIMQMLEDGKTVALMSDAGTPLISDPGYKLVRDAAAAGIAVHALPGASAVLAGLTISGLPTDAFHFAGFLPPKTVARRQRIGELAGVPGTLVLFEASHRVSATLADLAATLGPRPAALARELTKLNETVWRGTLETVAAQAHGVELKGECVIVIGAGEAKTVSDADIVEALTHLLATSSVRDAAAGVAEHLGVSRSRVYDLAIALQSGRLQTGSASEAPGGNDAPEGNEDADEGSSG